MRAHKEGFVNSICLKVYQGVTEREGVNPGDEGAFSSYGAGEAQLYSDIDEFKFWLLKEFPTVEVDLRSENYVSLLIPKDDFQLFLDTYKWCMDNAKTIFCGSCYINNNTDYPDSYIEHRAQGGTMETYKELCK